ncbi:MAG: PAS domain S-box protein [bacterium]|nr:PAS domain S-box protein [bacterium]
MKDKLIKAANRPARTVNKSKSEDYSTQKRIQGTLQKSEEQYRLMFTANPYPLFICDMDTLQFVEVNDAAVDQYGYSRAEFSSMTLKDIRPDSEIPRMKTIVAQAHRGINKLGVLCHRKKDGTIIDMDVSCHVTHQDGKTLSYILAQNVSERILAEQALERSLRDWYTIFEAVGHPTIILDENHTILESNSAVQSATKLSSGKLRGKKCWEVFHGSETKSAIAQCPLQQCLANGKFKSVTSQVEAFGGYYLVSCTPVPDREGNVEKIIHIMTDITERVRAEEALRESEEYLNKIINSIADPVFVKDSLHKFILVNDAFCNLFNHKREELLHKTDYDFIAKEEVDVFWERDDIVLAAGREDINEELFTRHGGDVRTLHTKKTRYIDNNGEKYVVGVIRDVTDRKRAEEELRSISAKQVAILTAVPDIITEVDNNKVYTWVNQAGIDFFGEDVIGKEAAYYFEGEQDTYQIVQPLFGGDSSLFFVESWQRRKDGEKRLLAWRCRNLRDAGGNVIGALSSAHDLTERRRSRVALEDSESKYRSLIEQSNDAIYLLLGDRFEIVNQRFCDMFEVTGQEVTDPKFNFMDMVAPSSKASIAERTSMVAQNQEPSRQYEFNALTKSGRELVLEASVSYVNFGSRVATQGILHDISERRLLEAQFRQAQKMEAVGRLAGGVAHDFNNLLSIITGHTELAVMSLKPGDPLQQEFKIVQEAALRASRLTRQLLAFSRKQALEPRIVNLNMIISDLEKMLHRIISSDLQMSTLFKRDLWKTKVDPMQIEQVIINLVVNACDAMPDGGELAIETDNVIIDDEAPPTVEKVPPGSYVTIAVSDTGQGMTEEIKARVFDPFFTTKSADKGTGLGLSTVYGIVKQHGGSVTVHSVLGEGSTFAIYLPRCMEGVEVDQKSSTAADTPGGIETILLVEDEDGVREIISSILKRLGYRVIEAKASGDAYLLTQKLKMPVALVITDLIMPNMNGIELVGHIRKLWPDVRVLYMSGYAEGSARHQALGILDAPFLQKPFSFSSLGRKVREVLDAKVNPQN